MHPTASSIIFRTPGQLDPRSFQVFGLHAKPASGGSPIGQFGTGLKYAIAVCLREGYIITITSAQPSGAISEFSFFSKPETFRDTEHDAIYMQQDGGEPRILPFTTALGAHWKPWMAFRELESNTRDEGGTTAEVGPGDIVMPAADETVIQIWGEGILEAYQRRNEIFLSEDILRSPATVHSSGGAAHPQATPLFYYRGVQVQDLSDEGERYKNTYNIKDSMSLTEDRTIQGTYSTQSEIALFLVQCQDEELCFRTLTAGKGYVENGIDFKSRLSFLFSPEQASEAFKAAVQRAMSESPVSLNRSALHWLSYESLDSRFVTSFDLDARQSEMLTRAKKFLKNAGYAIDQYPVKLVDIDTELAGQAKNNTIYLTRAAFSRGTKYLASTILEEFFHLKYHYSDHTTAFQDFLHDEILLQAEMRIGVAL